jgi:WS/DGAT/MGAT family acyltransferase
MLRACAEMQRTRVRRQEEPTMKRLTSMDAMFLHTETATQYMHTLKVAIFDPPEQGAPYSFAAQFAHIAAVIHRVPPFRRKAIPVPFGLHNPVWIDDPDFDLALHVHRAALPSPAGPEELAGFVENIASTPLNRDRPLWELWMVEGYQGDKVAAVAKVHHALADGVGTAEMLEDFMTLQPGEPCSAQHYRGETPPGSWTLLWQAARDVLRDLAKIPGQIGRFRAAKQRRAARNIPPERQPPEPYTGPWTALNGPIGQRRRFTLFRVALADVKRVRERFGVTINDVIVNMAAQAVREHLLERGALPERSLIASVPISQREAEVVHSYGNRVGSLCVALRTDIEDCIERLPAIHEAIEASKLEFEDTDGARMADMLAVMPPFAVRTIGTYSRRRSLRGESPAANLIVSNVPGPRQQLYDDNLPMREFFSIGPILEGIGLNITAWSFRDNLSFAILSCPRAAADPAEIRDRLLSALETMKHAAAVMPASTSASSS